MEKHIKALGIISIVFGVLGLLAGAGIMIAASLFLHLVESAHFGDPGEITALGTNFALGLGLLVGVVSASGLAGGIGLLKRRAWARMLVLVFGVVSLIFFPFGTILGVYTIWVLMKDETVRMFEATALAPAVAGSDGGAVSSKVRDYRLSGLVWIAAGAAFGVCVLFAVGLTKGAERALTVGIWGVIPLAVGVAFFLYGMTVRREQAGPTDAPGGGRRMGGLGVLGVVAMSLFASSAWAYTHEEVFQKTVPVTGIAKLSVRNFNGNISVQPWEKSEIQIEAKKQVKHSGKEAAEEYARKLEIAVEAKEGTLEVRTVPPHQKEDWDWVEAFFSLDWAFEGHARGVSVSYTISTPLKMDADLKTTNGTVKVGALEGRVVLRTTNGGLAADGVRGEIDGKATNGSVTFTCIEGGCDAVTTNGKITAEFLSLGSQGCDLRTTNGAIRVALPESARADLEARSTNGSVSSELPLSLQGDVSKRRMEGKINGGGPPLNLRTTNGSISIVKADRRTP